MTRHEFLGVLCAGGGMLVLGSSFAVSSLLIGYPALASQAIRYLLATAALALIAGQRGQFSASLSLRDLGWLCAVALTGLVGFNLFLLAALGESEPAAVGVVVGCSPLVLASIGPLMDGAAIVVDGVAGPMPTVAQAGAIVYLALVLTVGAFLIWYSAVQRLGVDRAGLFVGMVHVSALVGGVVLGTGTFSPTALAGAILVGGGVALGIGRQVPSGQTTAEPGQDRPLRTAN